ncbi:MAG TPA: diacylglycerol kinase family protein [Gillisia sp.]|nr:diacylglycerol kinase family protein [Gillisia sp.]
MKKIQVIHNPTAGDSEQGKKELLAQLEPYAKKISYASTDDDNWEDFTLDNEDLIVLCGGDGTVHKLVNVLLKKKKKQRNIPIYLVPAGTANNIATTLNLQSPRDFKIQENLKNYQLFDYGKISGLNDYDFFLEGIGFGIFPELIRRMKEKDEIPNETADEKLQRTLKVCKEIVEQMEPVKVKIDADGEAIKGKFLLAEVLNTRHIGPNLELAQQAHPGDGIMDLILISPEDRSLFLDYIHSLLLGKTDDVDVHKFVKVIKVKKVKMKSKASIMHVDDSILTEEQAYKFKLKVKEGEFRFI